MAPSTSSTASAVSSILTDSAYSTTHTSFYTAGTQPSGMMWDDCPSSSPSDATMERHLRIRGERIAAISDRLAALPDDESRGCYLDDMAKYDDEQMYLAYIFEHPEAIAFRQLVDEPTYEESMARREDVRTMIAKKDEQYFAAKQQKVFGGWTFANAGSSREIEQDVGPLGEIVVDGVIGEPTIMRRDSFFAVPKPIKLKLKLGKKASPTIKFGKKKTSPTVEKHDTAAAAATVAAPVKKRSIWLRLFGRKQRAQPKLPKSDRTTRN